MMLRAKPLDPKQAVAAGLVDEVASDEALLGEPRRLPTGSRAQTPIAVRSLKRTIAATAGLPSRSGWRPLGLWRPPPGDRVSQQTARVRHHLRPGKGYEPVARPILARSLAGRRIRLAALDRQPPNQRDMARSAMAVIVTRG